MQHDIVLIVDFGSQVTQLIARRVREAGVYCEIHPFSRAGEAFATLPLGARTVSIEDVLRDATYVRRLKESLDAMVGAFQEA